jgi:C-terminal processing protease CtpA/Prc
LWVLKKYLYTLLGVAAVALLLSSCKDDYYDNTPDEPLRISVDTIRVGNKAQKATIGVVARDAGWAMTGSEDWCRVDPASGEAGITQVSVAFASNEGESALTRSAVFTFTSGGVEKSVVIEQSNTSIEPGRHPDRPINEAIFSELLDWYYNGEPHTVPPDYNQSFDDFYFNYLSHLTRNEHDGNYWSTGNTRYIYSYIDTVRTSLKNTAPLNYGMEFELTTGFNGRMAARILYVEPGSPADRAGLMRGNWFHKVNDVQLADGEVTDDLMYRYYYNRLIDSLVHPVAGMPQKLGMQTFRATPPMELLDEGHTVTLAPENFSGTPIFKTDVFRIERLPAAGGGTAGVGYMMYNRFDPEYRDELIREFATKFKNQDIDHFILDLRYNKSGSVEMAELLGNLLAGGVPGVAGKTFAQYVFDGKSPYAGRTATFEAEENSIAADNMTVFVLTSPHTAGASELLINALRGLDQSVVKLVMIGSVTQGMSAGMVKRTYIPEGGDLEYSAWIVAFRCYNEAGRNAQGGDYIYGLAPNGGMVSEWDRSNNGLNLKWSTSWGWKGQLGSTEDQLVQRAVDMIAGREMVPPANVVNASQRQRSGYPREFAFPANMTMTVD